MRAGCAGDPLVWWSLGLVAPCQEVRVIPFHFSSRREQNKGGPLLSSSCPFSPIAHLHASAKPPSAILDLSRASTSSWSNGAMPVGSFSLAMHYSQLQRSVSAAFLTINPAVIYDQQGLLAIFYFFLNVAPALPSIAVCDCVPAPGSFL